MFTGILPHDGDFYPRSPCGERLEKVPADVYYQVFLSTLSLRRATRRSLRNGHYPPNFYPRSPCGERLRGWTLNINGPIFLSTLSLRRATESQPPCGHPTTNFYPRSPCGERLEVNNPVFAVTSISIHALLAESDNILCVVSIQIGGFLSTLSLRRATNARR